MHVLYHHRTAGDRVEGVHIMGMAGALRQLGHTVEISGPPGCDPERKPAFAANAPAEAGLRDRLKRFARGGPPVLFEVSELLYNAYSCWDIWRRGRRRRPDLIYERTTSNSVAPTCMARLWGIPIIQEVNVTVDIGHLRPVKLRRLSLAIERWMTRRATLFVTVSHMFKRMLGEAGFPEEKILVCQNAVHPEAFDPENAERVEWPGRARNGAVTLGYVGSFVPYQRVDMVVEAAKALAPSYPQARWLLLGDGADRPAVQRSIDEQGLGELFWMPGSVDHSLTPSYLKAMDVAVLPSSEQFNSPMKLFEYMAMGRAVVVPDRPAIREVIEHRRNGLVFRAGDGEAFTAALRELLDDGALRRRLGRQARQDVLERHTWSKVAQSVLSRLEQTQRQGKVSA